MPVLFVNGTNDFAYPLDSSQKSYRLAKGPRTLCVTVRMPHGHPQGWAPKEIGLFVDSVLRDGKSLARIKKLCRAGKQVRVTFESRVPVKEAALHYTTDGGVWQKRNWHTLPAKLVDGEVRVTLPADEGLVYFLTLTDERGAVVSTEHEAVQSSP